ncbi:MAG: FKBP-type peptidyl-prolyl cis-trans isomerase [Nanoarchaeota archaeon]
MVVKKGDVIEIRYQGWKKRSGEIFESNEDPKQPPLTMNVGSKEFITGLNEGVIGMNEGDTRTIDIPMDKAYGRKRHELIQGVPRHQLLGKAEPKVGKVLMLKHETGGMFPAIISDITADMVILDMNPPLAGEDLVFKVKLERIVKKGSSIIT